MKKDYTRPDGYRVLIQLLVFPGLAKDVTYELKVFNPAGKQLRLSPSYDTIIQAEAEANKVIEEDKLYNNLVGLQSL